MAGAKKVMQQRGKIWLTVVAGIGSEFLASFPFSVYVVSCVNVFCSNLFLYISTLFFFILSVSD